MTRIALNNQQIITDQQSQIKFLEEKLSAFKDNSTDAIILLDKNGIIEEVNITAIKLLGYTNDELIGNNINIIIPDNLKNKHNDYIKKYLKTGVSQIIGIGREVDVVRKDKSIFHADLLISHLKYEDRDLFSGHIRECIAVADKRQKIISDERLLKKFLDTASDGFILLDSCFNIIELDEVALRKFNYNRFEVLGKNIKEVDNSFEQDPKKYIKFQEVLKTGIEYKYEELNLDSQYGEQTFLTKVFKVESGIGIMFSDISEIKRAENALSIQMKYTMDILSNTPIMICSISYDLTTIFVNPAFTNFTGYSNDDIMGELFLDKIIDDEKKLSKVILAEIILERDVIDYEIEINSKNNENSSVLLNTVRKFNEENEVIEVLIFGVDITERKHLEEKKLKEEKFKGVLETAGATCHEFNQPLQILMGHIQLLQLKFGNNENINSSLKILIDQVMRMDKLTDDLSNITSQDSVESMDYLDKKILNIKKSAKHENNNN